MEEALGATFDHMAILSPRDIAEFWTVVPRFLQKRGKRHTNKREEEHMFHQFDTISICTMEDIETFRGRDYLSTTALGLAKTVKIVGNSGKRPPKGSPHLILQHLLIGKNSDGKQLIFDRIASTSVYILPEFDARSLSNFIYAYGLAECVSKFDDGSTIFDLFAMEAIPNLEKVNAQDLPNMRWSYATVEAPNPLSFRR